MFQENGVFSIELARLIITTCYFGLESKFIVLQKCVNEMQYMCLSSLRHKITGINLTLESSQNQIQERI